MSNIVTLPEPGYYRRRMFTIAAFDDDDYVVVKESDLKDLYINPVQLDTESVKLSSSSARCDSCGEEFVVSILENRYNRYKHLDFNRCPFCGSDDIRVF